MVRLHDWLLKRLYFSWDGAQVPHPPQPEFWKDGLKQIWSLIMRWWPVGGGGRLKMLCKIFLDISFFRFLSFTQMLYLTAMKYCTRATRCTNKINEQTAIVIMYIAVLKNRDNFQDSSFTQCKTHKNCCACSSYKRYFFTVFNFLYTNTQILWVLFRA